MTLWRMELARLLRTPRWVGLAAAYVLFGLLGPVVTRYQEALFRSVGGDIRIEAPPPTATQAIAAFVGNASQVGLIVTVFVAAGSLVFDAHPEWSAFLRTRVRVSQLLPPKFVVNAVASVASFALAAVVAWATTVVLIAPPPAGGMAAGIVYWSIYLGFVVSVVALAAGIVRSVIGAAGITVAGLLMLSLVGEVVASVKPFLPSTLVGSLAELADGASATAYLRAAIVAVLGGLACLAASSRLLARREV